MSTTSTETTELPDYYAPKTARANAMLAPQRDIVTNLRDEPYKPYKPKEKLAKPRSLSTPVPIALAQLVENVIRGVHAISEERVPTDREMMVLKQAVEMLKVATEIAEALGKQNAFAPLVNAALEELERLPSQSQAIERMRAMFAGSSK